VAAAAINITMQKVVSTLRVINYLAHRRTDLEGEVKRPRLREEWPTARWGLWLTAVEMKDERWHLRVFLV
jgi:hypothetical protein